MAAYDRSLTDFQCIIETLFACMAQVHHDAVAVHLLNHLGSETAHAIVGIAATGTVADVIIAIMAEGDIYHASLGKVLHIAQIMLQGKTILNTEHDALSALSLVAVKIGRSSGDTQVVAVLAHDFLYLVEDEISILQRSLHVEGHLATEALAYLRLRQVSHHGGSILMSIGHLVQIHEDAGVAMIELHALREEHRSIAMGIEC